MSHKYRIKQLRAAIRLPGNSQKSYKFFCRGLDIRVTKLVEATNGHSLVEAENDIWYDIVRGYGLRRSLFRRKEYFYGTKKQKTSTRGNG